MSLPLGASRRLSTTNATPDDDGLTQSLSQLSLTNQPSVNKSPRPKPASVPLHPSSRRSSASTSACPEQPPQSPSSAQLSRVTPHVASPPLLRKTSTSSLQSTSSVGTARPASRRSSLANVWSPSSSSSQLGKPPQKEEKPAVTANSVARDYFKSELEVHHGPTPTRHTKTIVILNDAVYGHRFSRPRTSRNALSTIVERPERIKACVMGISMAYVRLGGRHSEGPFPIQPTRDVGSLPSVPFRIRKTTNRLPLTSPAVTNVHGTKWMNELKDMCLSAESKLAMGGKELKRTRGSDDGPGQKLHEGDLYLCSESLEAIEGALGSVCEAVNTVFTTPFRRAFVGVRPPGHHCSASQPSGFCWVNNVHVGIMHGILTHGLTHAAIIDFDLHHGDGSQAITWQHNARATAAAKNSSAWKKTSIGYFSLHDINSYPCEMGDEEKVKNASLCIDNAHGQSVWNVHLHSWKSEKDFWVLYETRYKMLLEKTRVYLRNQADRLKALNQPAKAAIFFSAGFDASEWESAGMQRHQVNVPTEFYARLSQDVVKLAAEEGLHVDGRVISVLEGGYSDRALSSGIFSHLSGLVESQTAADVQTEADESPASVHSYDRSWWSSAALDKLEQPFVPPSPPRKARSALSTFSSPTQAATAKAADPARMRRTLSGVSTLTVIERPTSPTPPDVPWVVATQELCKLLIPTDRQTDSCKAEELNAEASKARRDRQSILMGIPPPAEQSSRPTSRMALRERRAKATGPVNEEGNGNIKTRRKNAEMDMFASPEKPSKHSPPSRPFAAQSSQGYSGTSIALELAREETAASLPESDSDPSRPASASSSRAQSGSKTTVKKPRSAAVTRKEVVSHARSPRKAPTATRNGPATAPGAATSDADTTLDAVTTGIKKIKINLITKSQREARERAKLEAEKDSPKMGGLDPSGPPSMLRKPMVISDSPTKLSAGKAPMQHAAFAAPCAQEAASISGESRIPVGEPCSPRTTTFCEQRSSGPSEDIDSIIGIPASDGSQLFVSYQPEGPDPIPIAQEVPLHWLPPNESTPSAKARVVVPYAKNNGLFHYSSGIPFAPRQEDTTAKLEPDASTGASLVTKVDDKPGSVWDVPETPRK